MSTLHVSYWLTNPQFKQIMLVSTFFTCVVVLGYHKNDK